MSNREVAGLQALAQRHGGELSVNPQTGLPEAGFLDSILPAVAGFGLSAVSGGMIDPLTAGAIVGGITALDSKDLSKGLTAGLGAWGGAGMAGGLGALGGATDPTNVASANYSTGWDKFTNAPMASLSTLGGGSIVKGGLPILAGLAPVAADMYDAPDEEDDKPPEQKKGYIRNYEFDPETGQYKQVSVNEAGGDPNKDVTSEAGVGGAFGGVGKSDYERANGMAEGGKTSSDSERIYDYLMGRGPNPMQFTHTQGPQVDYDKYMPKPEVPITPTTGILEPVYDPYGNIRRDAGRGQSQEQREQREADADRVDDYLGMTMNDYWALSPEDRADADSAAAERSPIRAGIINTAKTIGTLLMPGGLAMKAYDAFTGPLSSTGGPARYSAPPVTPNVDPQTFGGYYAGVTPNPYSMGPGTPGFNDPNTKPQNIGSVPTSDGNTETAARAEAIARIAGEMPNTPPPGLQTTSNDNDGQPQGGGGGGGGGGEGRNGPEGRGDPGGDRGGWGRGGGYAHGGIANLHQYNLGSYSDGGRLLKGPGDGVSDDIPATIGHGQPARLADGEFVIPARIVSEIGNGSTDAGARALYKMMDRIQAGRRKTVGKNQVAKNSKAVRHLPA